MNKKRIILICIIILLPVSVFYFLGLLELRLEEPRRGLVALEMFLSKDYIIPHINGWIYYNKPPLFNWSIALCYWIFNSFNELVVRLPSILAYFLTGFCIYRFTKSLFNKEMAVLAAFFFLTFSDIYFFGTEISGEIDLFYTLIIFLQIGSLCWFFIKGKYLEMFLLSYFLTAIAFLTKGMPSILFQGVTLIIICIYYRILKLLFNWKHFAGIAVFLLVLGGYFYAYHAKGGNVGNYLAKLYFDAAEKSGLESTFMDTVINFLETPLLLIRFLSPWILFLLLLINKKRSLPNVTANLLLWIVGINILPYLLTAHSKANYMYPLNPFIAILLAYYYTHLKDFSIKTNKLLETIFFVLILIVGAAVIVAPFIKEIIVALPEAWMYSICLAIAIFTVAYLYRRLIEYRIYLFILFWILLKLSVNIFYYPALQYGGPEMHYKEYVQKIVQKAGNYPIHVWGDISVNNVKVAAGPIHFDTVTFNTPTYVIFNVPFYYSSITHSVLQFSPTMKKDSIYLCVTDKKLISDKVEVLDVSRPNTDNHDIFYLIRAVEDIPYEPKNAGAYVQFE